VLLRYDFTNSQGVHFIDALGSYDQTAAGADPTQSVAGLGAASKWAIPTDTSLPAGVQGPGYFTAYNVSNLTVSDYRTVSTGGSTVKELTLTYTVDPTGGGSKNVVLAFGGHLAEGQNWGAGYGAGDFPGGSGKVYTSLDGAAFANVGVNPNTAITNRAPMLSTPAPVTVYEGQAASRTGTYSDPDGNPVTLSASLGTIIQTGNGTWTWSYATTDGPSQSQTATITADDGHGGITTVTFQLTVLNVAPVAVLGNDGPVSAGSPATVSFSGTFDPSEVDSAAGFRYSFALDPNGLATSYATAGSAASAQFTWAASGSYTVYARIFDKDGGFTDYRTVVVVNNAPIGGGNDGNGGASDGNAGSTGGNGGATGGDGGTTDGGATGSNGGGTTGGDPTDGHGGQTGGDGGATDGNGGQTGGNDGGSSSDGNTGGSTDGSNGSSTGDTGGSTGGSSTNDNGGQTGGDDAGRSTNDNAGRSDGTSGGTTNENGGSATNGDGGNSTDGNGGRTDDGPTTPTVSAAPMVPPIPAVPTERINATVPVVPQLSSAAPGANTPAEGGLTGQPNPVWGAQLSAQPDAAPAHDLVFLPQQGKAPAVTGLNSLAADAVLSRLNTEGTTHLPSQPGTAPVRDQVFLPQSFTAPGVRLTLAESGGSNSLGPADHVGTDQPEQAERSGTDETARADVQGVVFGEGNGDGAWSAGEEGLSGRVVRLVDETGAVVAQTRTGPEGKYLFVGVPAGRYRVEAEGCSEWASAVTPAFAVGKERVTVAPLGLAPAETVADEAESPAEAVVPSAEGSAAVEGATARADAVWLLLGGVALATVLGRTDRRSSARAARRWAY
jgi:hypothetical protein